MAYYRRRTYRRRPYRPRVTRKRTYRRKFSRFGRRKLNTGVYYFKRRSDVVYDWAIAAPISQLDQQGPLGNIPSTYNIGFRLQDVPGYTDFTGIYDQYRIRAVKVNFIPIGNVSNSVQLTGVTGLQPPPGSYAIRCFSAFDPNSDGVGITGPNAVNLIQEYQNSKWSPYNRIHKRYIKPKIELSGGVSTINISGKQPWLQCADGGSTIHYGLPVVIDPTFYPYNTMLYRISCTYYLQFARPK